MVVGFGLEEKIYQLVQDNPTWREFLTEMVQFEEEHEHEEYYNGWTWKQVHTASSIVNKMISSGIVDNSYHSRSGDIYKLRSRDNVKAALSLDERPASEQLEPVDIDSLFDLVIGHEKVKKMLRYALKATKPVHVLLHGSVATAKSLLLQDIATIPAAQMYLGSTTTKSGLVGMLLNNRPAILIIDEVDKMSAEDRQPLLSLMASGMVYRLQHGKNDKISLSTKVFAAANDLARIEEPIRSRFVELSIPSYTREQFVAVVQRVLMVQEGFSEQVSILIANVVSQHSLDVRDAVHVARMSKGLPNRVFEIIQTLWPIPAVPQARKG